MKTKYLISFIIISFLITGSFFLADRVFAEDSTGLANIQYPVKELGNCQNEAVCKTYCDKPKNMEVCIDFAEKNNLMSEEEIEMAKNFMAAGAEGPGGCQGKEECEAYCNNISNIDECLAFAEENNLIPPEKLEEAKKVQAAIKRGVKPPPCGNKEKCDVYCDEPDHMEECITFGIEAGFIQGKELEDVQKMLAAVKRGIKPPPCKGKEACDEYCQNPDHMEECMTFAMEAGFMNEQEKADSQKMLQAIKKGVKPPNCRGKEECDVYCQQEEHFEECMNFAEAAGFMTPEDAVMARKTGGKGPGDCKGKEECEAFCNNPDNQETCFNFGKEHGLIPEEDLKMMEEGKQRMKESLEQAPPEVIECLNSAIGSEQVEKFKSGSAMPPREIGDQMQSCFQKMGPPPGQEGQQMMQPGQPGPGGCQTPEECKTYCESNPEECQKFQPSPGVINPGEQIMPQQAGPGGCKSPEECQAYCESHPDECKNVGPGGEGQFAPGTAPGGQPGTYQPPTGCQTPEECQRMMPPPNTCQGENCQSPPPQNQIQPYQQQPPMVPIICPEGGCPPGDQQPPTNQEGQQQPPPVIQDSQQPPAGNMGPQPPPSTETPPPPTSFIGPDSLLGSLINLFLSLFKH